MFSTTFLKEFDSNVTNTDLKDRLEVRSIVYINPHYEGGILLPGTVVEIDRVDNGVMPYLCRYGRTKRWFFPTELQPIEGVLSDRYPEAFSTHSAYWKEWCNKRGCFLLDPTIDHEAKVLF